MRSASFMPDTADLIAANRLHFWSSLKSKRTVWSYVAGSLLFALIGTLFAQRGGAWAVITGATLGFIFWSFLLACIFAMNYILIPARSRRVFRQLKALQSSTDINWSSERIQLQSAQGSSDFDWRDFVRIVQGRNVILLFQSDYMFNFIPRRAVSDEQARDIVESAATRRT
nr:YcxB family protein [uncultured Sphingosinicella sp.]